MSTLTCRWSSSANVSVLLKFTSSLRHLHVNFYCKCSADSEKCSVNIILESQFSAALLGRWTIYKLWPHQFSAFKEAISASLQPRSALVPGKISGARQSETSVVVAATAGSTMSSRSEGTYQ